MKKHLKSILFLTLLSLGLSACNTSENELNTDELSAHCKSRLIDGEFIVKFKHEDTYRNISAKNAEDFLESTVRPHQDDIEAYGLNFKYNLSDSLSKNTLKLTRLKDFSPTFNEPWVKELSRSDFLIHHGFMGQNIKVAVLDTGIDLNSKAFDSNFILKNGKIIGKNIAENNSNVQDLNGHGTMVSSLISSSAIATNNSTFEGGLAPKAQLLPVKIFPQNSRTTNLNTIIESIDYAIEQKVNIINASWGGSEHCSPLLRNKLEEVWMENILFVTSAGDKSKNLTYQADYPASFQLDSALVVSAINKNLEIPSRANFGGTIKLFAPGQDVPALSLNDQIQIESGTSLAAAIASGGAALLMSAYPDLNVRTITQAMSLGSRHENPLKTKNIIDLKSSYYFLESRGLLATSPL